ncbi:MAG: MFS transporter, partial [Gemmiger sp.]
RKKPVAFAGYATGLVYKLALLFATGWPGVLAARVIDRLGKGIRTAPRDAMVSESAGAGQLGRSFGVHKALDMAGSAIGILLAYWLLKQGGGDPAGYRKIFLVSVLPTLLALLMFAFVREPQGTPRRRAAERTGAGRPALDGRLKLYLTVVFLFTLGNSSNSFLLLRAGSAGVDDTEVILLYFLYNLTASLLAVPFGGLSDHVGRKWILTAGYLLFSAVYVGFAFAQTPAAFAVLFVLYGGFTAMTAGVERALVAEIAPEGMKGTVLGLHSTVAGVALLPASVICGALWDRFGSAVPFLFGAAMSALAALLLALFLRPGTAQQT